MPYEMRVVGLVLRAFHKKWRRASLAQRDNVAAKHFVTTIQESYNYVELENLVTGCATFL